MPSRPNYRRRANSQDSVRDVVIAIRSPTRVNSEHERKNLVYLFEVTLRGSGRRVYKIGKTHTTMQNREASISRSCKHELMEPVPDLSYQHTSHAELAETIFKAEFKLQLDEFPCVCRARHTEYFNISRDVAVDGLIRWRDFCAKKPWDLKTRQLLPFWDQRLQKWEHEFSKAGRLDPADITERWRRFAEPTLWDCAQFYAVGILSTLASLSPVHVLLILTWLYLLGSQMLSLNVAIVPFIAIVGLMLYCCTWHTMQFPCQNLSSWLFTKSKERSIANVENAPREEQMETIRAATPRPHIGAYPDSDVEYLGEVVRDSSGMGPQPVIVLE